MDPTDLTGGVHTDNCPQFCICRLKPSEGASPSNSSSASPADTKTATSHPMPAGLGGKGAVTQSHSSAKREASNSTLGRGRLGNAAALPRQPGGRIFVVTSSPQNMAGQVPGAVYVPPNTFAQTWQGEYSEQFEGNAAAGPGSGKSAGARVPVAAAKKPAPATSQPPAPATPAVTSTPSSSGGSQGGSMGTTPAPSAATGAAHSTTPKPSAAVTPPIPPQTPAPVTPATAAVPTTTSVPQPATPATSTVKAPVSAAATSTATATTMGAAAAPASTPTSSAVNVSSTAAPPAQPGFAPSLQPMPYPGQPGPYAYPQQVHTPPLYSHQGGVLYHHPHHPGAPMSPHPGMGPIQYAPGQPMPFPGQPGAQPMHYGPQGMHYPQQGYQYPPMQAPMHATNSAATTNGGKAAAAAPPATSQAQPSMGGTSSATATTPAPAPAAAKGGAASNGNAAASSSAPLLPGSRAVPQQMPSFPPGMPFPPHGMAPGPYPQGPMQYMPGPGQQAMFFPQGMPFPPPQQVGQAGHPQGYMYPAVSGPPPAGYSGGPPHAMFQPVSVPPYDSNGPPPGTMAPMPCPGMHYLGMPPPAVVSAAGSEAAGDCGRAGDATSSVSSSVDQNATPCSFTATSPSPLLNDGATRGGMKTNCAKPHLEQFLQYGLLVDGDLLRVTPDKGAAVLMRATNRSSHCTRRLELHDTPVLGARPGMVGPKAVEFLKGTHVDVEEADGRLRIVFASFHAPVVARWAAAGFPEPPEVVEAEGGSGKAVEVSLLAPLKVVTVSAQEAERAAKMSVVVRIHGNDLGPEKQFVLGEMRRLLLEDPEYQWDAATGTCRLATVFHFDTQGGRSELGVNRNHSNRINRINSNLNLDGLGLFQDQRMDTKLYAIEGRGSTDDELCLPYNDIVLDGVYDASWVDVTTGGEFEWESFLSFGGDGDGGLGGMGGCKESEMLSDQEVPVMADAEVPSLGDKGQKRKGAGDVTADAKRPRAVPPPSQVALYGTQPFTWGLPQVPMQPSARFRLDEFMDKVAKGGTGAMWGAQQVTPQQTLQQQWHTMPPHMIGGEPMMGRGLMSEEHHKQLMRHHPHPMPLYHHPPHPHHAHAGAHPSHHSLPPAPLMHHAPAAAMVGFGGDEGEHTAAMMKEWMEFHRLTHVLMESVLGTVRRAGDPPPTEAQQAWGAQALGIIKHVAAWAASPAGATAKKQHNTVVGTSGIIMETLEMLLTLQKLHRRKCPPKQQECFLAAQVCAWARALLERAEHAATLQDANRERVREDLHLDNLRKTFKLRVFHRPTFMKDPEVKDFKHFLLEQLK